MPRRTSPLRRGNDFRFGARRFWGTSMLKRLSARSGAVPVWKLRRWLPGVLAAAIGLGGLAGWASAQSDTKPMPVPGRPGTVVPVPGTTATAPQTPQAPPEKTVSVYFKSANWDDVLDWFSKESGLTPILTVKPTGSVSIEPPKTRKFTHGRGGRSAQRSDDAAEVHPHPPAGVVLHPPLRREDRPDRRSAGRPSTSSRPAESRRWFRSSSH